MTVPTKGETYVQLLEHLRRAQESAAMLAHLHNADGDAPGMVLGRGWFNICENIKKMQNLVTQFAKRGLQ